MYSTLPSRDIVLLGIGHTNAHVLRMWRMQPVPDARLTCVSNFPVATYSGMLPGVLAGQYPPERMEIDLVRLCAAAGARLVLDDVAGVDVPGRCVLFKDRPPLPFDVLSIGIGSVPEQDVPVEGDTLVTIKPMQTFLRRLAARLDTLGTIASARPLRVCIVGGGAGGVEIAFCLQAFLLCALPGPFFMQIVHSGKALVTDARPRTTRLVERRLEERCVDVRRERTVTRVAADHVVLDDGETLPADLVLWATGAAPPPLLAALSLPKDDRGFLLTRPTLLTTADAPVFVVGDTGTRTDAPIRKAGVYAVRQGPVLWDNLHRLLDGRPLLPYEPQAGFLKLLNTGDGRAIGEYKGLTFSGRWTWRLKDRIDGRFMDKYQKYEMRNGMRSGGGADQSGASTETSGARRAAFSTLGFSRFRTPHSTLPTPMKCAGCGCKLGADVLARVLRRLEVPRDDRILLGLDTPDDAAVLKLSNGLATVVTTDFFTAPLDDPYLVGRIAALNAASDAFAMGAQPVAALANVTIPEGPAAQQEELLFQVLAGSLREFTALRTALVGGHTIEGPQVTAGFTVLAEPMGDALCTRSALQPGDALLLTKPLGVGVLLAAHGRATCPADDFMSLVATMLQSNASAARLAVTAGVRAMTDVTGFGLAGHLLEMLRASRVSAELTLDAIPLLPGAAERLACGMESTLAPANRRAEPDIAAAPAARSAPAYAALFDPQTSGGLLIGLPTDRGPALLAALQQEGIPASSIGRVTASEPSAPRLKLV